MAAAPIMAAGGNATPTTILVLLMLVVMIIRIVVLTHAVENADTRIIPNAVRSDGGAKDNRPRSSHERKARKKTKKQKTETRNETDEDPGTIFACSPELPELGQFCVYMP